MQGNDMDTHLSEEILEDSLMATSSVVRVTIVDRMAISRQL